jgi:FkbM family methyltransferase
MSVGARIKQLARKAVSLTPYRVVRTGHSNRFQAITETLRCLRQRGYAPRQVIDAGANVGSFALEARKLFGSTCSISLFEPQPACQPILQALSKETGFTLYAAAVGSINGETLRLAVETSSVTTGAYISTHDSPRMETVPVPVVTLDWALSETLTIEDRALLKLDLQGWELEALKGAGDLLTKIEVILVEVSFFAQAYEPPIATMVEFLSRTGFDLHDVAALTGRRRDNRAHQADFVFVAKWSPLRGDSAWA